MVVQQNFSEVALIRSELRAVAKQRDGELFRNASQVGSVDLARLELAEIFKDRGEMRAPPGGSAAPHRSHVRIAYPALALRNKGVHGR
jgi:hypothetical protein